MRRDDAESDLALLAALPGTKIVIKGNHDYWWTSGNKLICPGLHAPPLLVDDAALGFAGTRGWFVPESGSLNEAADRKILERERGRLRASLQAIRDCAVKIVLLHYPPHPFLDELAEAGVDAVVYGHLHLGSPPEVERLAHDGEAVNGIRLYCVACDRIDFTPRRILPLA